MVLAPGPKVERSGDDANRMSTKLSSVSTLYRYTQLVVSSCRIVRPMSQTFSRTSPLVTVGIVGCAHCHTPWIAGVVLKARADLRVKSLYDHHRRSRAEGTAAITGGTVVDDASAIWNDPEIQAVFVLSETNLHERDVLAACVAKKSVVRRKAAGVERRRRVSHGPGAGSGGRLVHDGLSHALGGNFHLLARPDPKGNFGKITRLRYITCAGGTLKSVFNPEGDFAWMRDPQQSGGGTFLDLGTHALDAVLWLMGERVVAATSVVGKVRALPQQGEDYGEGLLEFESGAIGSMAGAG